MYEVKNLSKVKALADLTPEAMEAFRSREDCSAERGNTEEVQGDHGSCGRLHDASSYCIRVHNQIARFGSNR